MTEEEELDIRERLEDKINLHCIEALQDKIFDECMEKFDSGKLKNQGDKQLAYAGQYFQLEMYKRDILKRRENRE